MSLITLFLIVKRLTSLTSGISCNGLMVFALLFTHPYTLKFYSTRNLNLQSDASDIGFYLLVYCDELTLLNMHHFERAGDNEFASRMKKVA